MKIEFDEDNREVKYLPENDNDIFRLERATECLHKGTWRQEFVSKKLVFVSFKAIDLFNGIVGLKK